MWGCAEQIEGGKIAENTHDVGHDHDHVASIATRHSSTASLYAASTIRAGRVQMALRGMKGCHVAHASSCDDQPRADETERRYQAGAVDLPIKSNNIRHTERR